MAQPRSALAGRGRPTWVTHPLATDYLTEQQIREDDLWSLAALLAYNERLRAWCAEAGADWVTEGAGYPRLPRDRDWTGVAHLEQCLQCLQYDDNEGKPDD